jgi:hypothetical protein
MTACVQLMIALRCMAGAIRYVIDLEMFTLDLANEVGALAQVECRKTETES